MKVSCCVFNTFSFTHYPFEIDLVCLWISNLGVKLWSGHTVAIMKRKVTGI